MRDQVEIQENLRSIPVGKNILHAKREDPYGFWTIHFERGEVPDFLKGTYTSFSECWKKMAQYINTRPADEGEDHGSS
jgi:hypothetical protein